MTKSSSDGVERFENESLEETVQHEAWNRNNLMNCLVNLVTIVTIVSFIFFRFRLYYSLQLDVWFLHVVRILGPPVRRHPVGVNDLVTDQGLQGLGDLELLRVFHYLAHHLGSVLYQGPPEPLLLHDEVSDEGVALAEKLDLQQLCPLAHFRNAADDVVKLGFNS